MSIASNLNRILALAYRPPALGGGLAPRQSDGGDYGGAPPGTGGGAAPDVTDLQRIAYGSGTRSQYDSGVQALQDRQTKLQQIAGMIPSDYVQLDELHWADPGTRRVYRLVQDSAGAPALEPLTEGDSARFLASIGISDPALSAAAVSGDGVGYANLAQRQQEFAYQQQQDKIANARALIAALANGADMETNRRQLTNTNTLAARPYVMPAGQQYFSGAGPDSYGVKAGYAAPVRIAPVPFDPASASGPTPYDQLIQDQINRLLAMSNGA